MKKLILFSICLLFVMNVASWAGPVLPTGIDTPSAFLPPNGDYTAPGTVSYPQDVHLNNLVHNNFTGVVRTPIGGDEDETFNSSLYGLIDVPSSGIYGVGAVISGPVSVLVKNYTSGQTGTFQTEIVSMSLSGNIGGIAVAIRESPTLSSTGQTTISDLGGGLYHIDSFFDVFTELSVNGGAFLPASTGSERMTLVPEPTTIALLGLGAIVLRKKK